MKPNRFAIPQDGSPDSLSRRGFLGATAAMLASGAVVNGGAISTAYALQTPTSAPKKYPIGIELYAVRGELARDLPNTLRTVARIGYEVVEFYSPYLAWTIPYAKGVRTQLDDLGLRCFSTHNSWNSFSPESMGKAIEINQVLGARHMILASPPPNTTTLEDWKRACGQFTTAVEQLKPHGLFPGFHNHLIEWKPI
ncbi:MAG: twin-arginine translocation signal domain-containing protein, partial [bacterium]